MAISYITTLRNSRLALLTTGISTSGRLYIYSGSVPGVNVAVGGGNDLLANLPLSATFAPAPSAGELTADPITPTNAAITGTATFFRLVTSGGTVQAQGTVGTVGADLNLDSTSLVAGVSVNVTSFEIIEGNA